MNAQSKSIAIIPARGGSKRIPDKNIKNFLGKPIIARVIESALNAGIFDEVIVSTDSSRVSEIAKQHGAKVPFLRSDKNSDDHATTVDVLSEVVSRLKTENYTISNACCIYPTAVLVSANHLKEANAAFLNSEFDTLISALQFSYPIQRAFKAEDKKLKMAWPQYKLTRSQDLDKHYHDAGQFYFFNVDRFETQNQLFTDNTGFYLLKEYEAQDIDNPEDWTMAELKFNFLNSLT